MYQCVSLYGVIPMCLGPIKFAAWEFEDEECAKTSRTSQTRAGARTAYVQRKRLSVTTTRLRSQHLEPLLRCKPRLYSQKVGSFRVQWEATLCPSSSRCCPHAASLGRSPLQTPVAARAYGPSERLAVLHGCWGNGPMKRFARHGNERILERSVLG